MGDEYKANKTAIAKAYFKQNLPHTVTIDEWCNCEPWKRMYDKSDMFDLGYELDQDSNSWKLKKSYMG